MENKETKNVIKEEEEELKGGKAIHKDLNPVSLIVRDDAKLKELVSKSFAKMTEEEKKQLPTAKFRIVSKKNPFNKKISKYIRLIFGKNVYFERLLDKEEGIGEEELLKIKYPQLFETPKTKDDIVYVHVPVRLYSYYNEEKDRYSYQFSAELCSSIIMRGAIVRDRTTNKNRCLNNFNNVQLELLMSRDTEYRFCLLDKAVVDEELEDDSLDFNDVD